MPITLSTRRDTTRLGHRIAAALEPGSLVLLDGDLGVGKSFLARAIGRRLGVAPEVAMASPTFTLVQEYETPRGRLLHADLYRLREDASPEVVLRDVERLGLAERRAEGAMLLVEWGQGLDVGLGGAPSLRVCMTMESKTRYVAVDGPLASSVGG